MHESTVGGQMSSGKDGSGREVYLEFLTVGDSIKVTAIDSESGTEVSIVGSSRAPKNELERVAIDKLQYVLDRDAADPSDSDGERSAKEGGKGWVV